MNTPFCPGLPRIGPGFAALGMLIAGCASPSSPSPRPASIIQEYRRPAPVGRQTPERIVKASWYGPGFAGKPTTSGERYNPNQLTAASKTLPLGSIIRVTNLRNGRSVRVRINDCGPYVHDRSLDLSHRAARKIGITRDGVAPVKVTKISTPAGAESCAD